MRSIPLVINRGAHAQEGYGVGYVCLSVKSHLTSGAPPIANWCEYLRTGLIRQGIIA